MHNSKRKTEWPKHPNLIHKAIDECLLEIIEQATDNTNTALYNAAKEERDRRDGERRHRETVQEQALQWDQQNKLNEKFLSLNKWAIWIAVASLVASIVAIFMK